MRSHFLAIILASCCVPIIAGAQEAPAHNELRALRDQFLAKLNSGDIEGQLGFLHPNVIVTWHNAEVSRGRDAVRAYLERMLRGPEKVVEKFQAEVKVDELSVLHGDDTAIAFGSADEHFTLTSGRSFNFTGRWSATMVRENGVWLVANLHASDNLFDNPLLNATKAIAWGAGAAALILGALIGWLFGRRQTRRIAA